MNTLIFRGAYLRHFDFRRSESNWFVRLHFTADFTTTVAEAMGWERPGPGITSAKLEGELVALTLILTPNESALRSHEIQLDIESASDFEYCEVSEGDGAAEELRFKVRTSVDGAEAIIGAYTRRIGQSASQLRISYAKQESLPLEAKEDDEDEEDDDSPNCEDCANEIPLVAGSTDLHASGQPCTKASRKSENEAQTLPSVVQMGGSHQRGRKRNQVVDVTQVN